MIQPTLLLGLPAHLRVEQIEITSQMLTLSLAVETSQAACPLCQHYAHRVHSHYTRTLQDLPCTGKALRLLILVRRFFCENKECVRRIFAERFPELTGVYARRTTRGTEQLAERGLCARRKSCGRSQRISWHGMFPDDHFENFTQRASTHPTDSIDARCG